MHFLDINLKGKINRRFSNNIILSNAASLNNKQLNQLRLDFTLIASKFEIE
jgi:hypothetical protein